MTRLWGTIEQGIETPAQSADRELGRLARHLHRYQTEFFRYLEDSRLPATNNDGEQTLRFAVVLRTGGCCQKTPRGDVRSAEQPPGNVRPAGHGFQPVADHGKGVLGGTASLG